MIQIPYSISHNILRHEIICAVFSFKCMNSEERKVGSLIGFRTNRKFVHQFTLPTAIDLKHKIHFNPGHAMPLRLNATIKTIKAICSTNKFQRENELSL